MKISSHFLSLTSVVDSIEFQKLSFKISILKLKSALSITDGIDETLFKNLQYTTDNLLLSLRMAEMYVEAVEILNELNKFLKKFNLDTKYMELILLNWCKIKRDASKLKSTLTKKTYEENLKYKTINKLLKTMNPDYSIDYLFEELRILKYFCTDYI